MRQQNSEQVFRAPRVAICACLLLGACAVPVPATGPPIVLHPGEAEPVVPRVVPDSVASKLVKRDAAALRRQVRRFVASEDTPLEQIKPVDPLIHVVEIALGRMEKNHTRQGYRPDDVAKARGAADALAAYLSSIGAQN